MKFSIYYPIKPFHINQVFGNPDPVYSGMGLKGHNGVDLAAYHGEPVYATHDGNAMYEIDPSGGHGVVIRTTQAFDYPDFPNGAYFKTIYWHLCDSTKEPQFKSPVESFPNGVAVKAGDLIGYADNTGVSSGNHLHFGCKPMLFNEPPGTWYNAAQNNGYLGAIDPMPYFNGIFAQDLNPRYLFNKDLHYGMFDVFSHDIYELQKRLIAENLADFTPTGWFGALTKVAVQAYQEKYGIPQTGYVGLLTRASLNK